jgi:hypothetical protein
MISRVAGSGVHFAFAQYAHDAQVYRHTSQTGFIRYYMCRYYMYSLRFSIYLSSFRFTRCKALSIDFTCLFSSVAIS